MGLPLEGIRVLDLGQVVSIPFCGQLLAWMGADVILVETTTHTTTRGAPPFAHGVRSLDTSGTANLLATNKRSCAINLKTQAGVALVRRLAAVSDVIMDNFATRTMERLGLGYGELRQIRPDIIAVSLGAFGRTGPIKDFIGLHSAVNLFSGVGGVTGYGPEDRPRLLGSILPDPLSGSAACLAVLEALYHRRRTGQGQFIDLSMAEVYVNLIPEAVAEYSRTGRQLLPLGNRDPSRAPQGVYRCKGKDAWVAIAVSTEQEWQALCEALGQPALSDDPRFVDERGRWQHHQELDALITAWTELRTPGEAMQELQRAGVPAGACPNAKGILNDSHLRARRTIVRTDHPRAGRRRMVGVPWKMNGGVQVRYRAAPCIGQDTEEVLTELLGLSGPEVRQLRADGVLV